jgi:hypothetical protein
MSREEGAMSDDEPAGAPPDGPDPRLQDGVEHLQRAAREVIAASRALLDVAEELVDDPHAVGSLVTGLGSLAKAAGRATMGWTASAPSTDRAHDDGDDDGDHGVQRIPIS